MGIADNLVLAITAIRAHKLRATLTVIGLTMGVATLITVMTVVQGANLYVEQKVANLGTNVFRVSRLPFAITDFTVLSRAQRNKNIVVEDLDAVTAGCGHCQFVGASVSSTLTTRFRDHQLDDTGLFGHTPSMAEIDTRNVVEGRYFTDQEDRHAAAVCLIGDRLAREFFADEDPLGRIIRAENQEFTVIGVFEKIGSVLGQDQDNFIVIPLQTYMHFRGLRNSLTLQVKTAESGPLFEQAQDDARSMLRIRRHITINREEDFFIGTAQNYISLWESISSAFFAVFVMVSSISAVVGGIVIMNVMLVSVTERTKEIGVRRAVGATQQDILRQFLAESIVQCIIGGIVGVGIGFTCALALRTLTSFPAAVQTWVAVLGVVISSVLGVFFGIYPAIKASKLDPVEALRSD
ncbi:MAG TPA: ABC transporter permease [Candidatus Sulfopaludibacter sp.]|jgi:putative ABC transport system permease protein|nr:ABC transporter permease [Candidatus Sulfopaludibacter sp.]